MFTFTSALKVSFLVWILVLPFESLSAQVSCGEVLTTSTVLTQDLTCAADGLRIGADGVTVDCAGHVIRGPGTTVGTGLSVPAVSGVTIARCHITGFRTAIQAQDAADLRVIDSVLSGPSGGIRCAACPRVTIEGNRLEGHLTQIDLMLSPDSKIIDNVTAPHSRGGGHFWFRDSPRALIAGNRAPDGGAALFLTQSDDSNIEDNDLARNATIHLFNSNRCRILRNTLVRGAAPQPNFGGSVYLNGSSDNLLRDNRVEGTLGIFLTGNTLITSSNSIIYRGADRNIVEDNVISDSGWGLFLLGASENRIVRNRIERTELGLGVYGLIDPESDFDVPTDRNVVGENVLAGGLYGISTWRASGNLFKDNEVTNQWIGVQEGAVGPFSSEVNEYQGNSIAGNRLFGLLVIGGTPLLRRNEFRENGTPDPLPADLEPYGSLLGDLRGGIALLPFVGDAFTTFDNADPGDDVLAEPVIGGPGEKNLFLDNDGIDIYALDTRAANALSLERDNQFKGHRALRIRQDWFGLVRVENSDGQATPDAEVAVRDASGATVATIATGVLGYAPAAPDPGRSQGRSPFEDGGPVASWQRFTEFTVDGRGRRVEFTPHTLLGEATTETGCAIYSWDGIPGKTVGSQSPDGRYQIAVVQLGTMCSVPVPFGNGRGQRVTDFIALPASP